MAGNSLSRQIPATQKFEETLGTDTTLIFNPRVSNGHKLATAPIYCKLVGFILQQTPRLCAHGNPLYFKLVLNCFENIVVIGINLLHGGGMGWSLRGWLGSISFVS